MAGIKGLKKEMGFKPTTKFRERVRITISLEPDMAKLLILTADKEGHTVSQCIRHLILKALGTEETQ